MKNIIKMQIILWVIVIIFQNNAYALFEYMQIDMYPADVEFQIVSPDGRIAGYDSRSGIITEKFGFSYGYNHIADDVTGQILTEFNEFTGVNMASGLYTLKIFAKKTSTYNLSISLSWAEVRIQPHIFGIANIGQLNTYEFNIPNIPPVGGGIIFTKISSPTDLTKDINTAASLNYIGNPKFVSEIIEDINEIEKKRAKMLKNASRSETEVHKKSTENYSVADNYREILEDITEAYTKPTTKKFVTTEGYNVLKEDLEYIIGH